MDPDTVKLTHNRPQIAGFTRLNSGWRRALGLCMGLGVAGALVAACAPADGISLVAGGQRSASMEVLEQTAEFSVVPTSRAMVHTGDALVVLERNLGSALEQRIVLPNATALRGDNVIHVRAQTSSSGRLSEFNFAEISTRMGGLPTPFQRVTGGTLQSGEDSLGSFVYARENVGNTLCVLVLRRMTVGARSLPRGAQALDVMMRNCVDGSLEQALAPISARPAGVSGSAQGAVYTLSPHAAPRLQ